MKEEEPPKKRQTQILKKEKSSDLTQNRRMIVIKSEKKGGKPPLSHKLDSRKEGGRISDIRKFFLGTQEEERKEDVRDKEE